MAFYRAEVDRWNPIAQRVTMPGDYHGSNEFVDRAFSRSSAACPVCLGPMTAKAVTAGDECFRIGQVEVDLPERVQVVSVAMPAGATMHRCAACDVRFVSLP